MDNLKNLRILAIVEGISMLVILFVTMPLKYIYNNPMPNKFSGMIHGFLFISYLYMVYACNIKQKWDKKTLIILVLAAIIPFGPFIIDKKYLKS